MSANGKLSGLVTTRPLTRQRIFLALTVAVIADLLQIALWPLAWTLVEDVIDVAAMLMLIPVLGFHILLLPTFALELIPVVDMVPTWTGCVIGVLVLQAKQTREEHASVSGGDVVDVASKVQSDDPPPASAAPKSPPSLPLPTPTETKSRPPPKSGHE